jgi:hypothetical protein
MNLDKVPTKLYHHSSEFVPQICDLLHLMMKLLMTPLTPSHSLLVLCISVKHLHEAFTTQHKIGLQSVISSSICLTAFSLSILLILPSSLVNCRHAELPPAGFVNITHTFTMSSLLAPFSLSGILCILYCVILSLHSLSVVCLEFSVSPIFDFLRHSRIYSIADDQNILFIFCLIAVST